MIFHTESPKLCSSLVNTLHFPVGWIGLGTMNNLPLLCGGHRVPSLGYFTSVILVGLLKIRVTSVGISVLCSSKGRLVADDLNGSDPRLPIGHNTIGLRQRVEENRVTPIPSLASQLLPSYAARKAAESTTRNTSLHGTSLQTSPGALVWE